jgi:hypothetical protein
VSGAEVALVAAGIAGAAYVARRKGPAPRPSWDVPPAQKWHADRVAQCAALYQAGRSEEARTLLRDRAVDWALIRAATAAQPLNPVARRIAATLERDGSGMFLNELHRLAATDCDLALTTIARALTDYTGPAGADGARR